MPNPAELAPQSIDLPSPEIHEAEVIDNADTPGDEVRCVIPSLDDRFHTEPMQWMPFTKPSGLFYPKKKDRALVSYHEDGEPAILAWWPSASEPDHAF